MKELLELQDRYEKLLGKKLTIAERIALVWAFCACSSNPDAQDSCACNQAA
jgi:hypothetical protein